MPPRKHHPPRPPSPAPATAPAPGTVPAPFPAAAPSPATANDVDVLKIAKYTKIIDTATTEIRAVAFVDDKPFDPGGS